MALWLNEDLVRAVAAQHTSGDVATKMALVCSDWRHAIAYGDGEAFDGLDVGETVKAELRAITPNNYLGFASKLVRG